MGGVVCEFLGSDDPSFPRIVSGFMRGKRSTTEVRNDNYGIGK